jgi:hypothetical protein
MNFHSALRALAAGKQVRRVGGLTFAMQPGIVPILTNRLATSVGIMPVNDNWLMTRFVIMVNGPALGAPVSFSDEDMAANDWRIARAPKIKAEVLVGVDGSMSIGPKLRSRRRRTRK